MTTQDVLKQCKVEGLVVKLPDTPLDRKVYVDVANKLDGIGGKWNRKVQGFIFPQNPSELLEQIAGGEKRNLKKEFQFYATPDDLADTLVKYADINNHHLVLEPSAGQGAIISAIYRANNHCAVDYYEIMELNKNILSEKIQKNRTSNMGANFLKESDNGVLYDVIVANPPYSAPLNSDIDHIRQMYKCLKKRGRLVSLASTHWMVSQNKKETEFKNWLREINAEVHDVEAGVFKKSGTNIATVIIVINK